jgi:uncharacterized protein (TIGR02145 family)
LKIENEKWITINIIKTTMRKMMNKNSYVRRILWLLPAVILFLSGLSMEAQVTVGSKAEPQPYSLLELDNPGAKKGLRMAHLTTAQRDSLTQTTGFDTAKQGKGRGLTIFNTTTKCLEFWNDNRWISICTGNANVTLSPPLPDPVDEGGGDFGPITPEDHPAPNCGNAEPYSVLVISGMDFIHVSMTNPATGAFTLHVDENQSAVSRTGIVRVVNNCTSEYKDFPIRQSANSTVCNKGNAAPVVNTTTATVCAGGSAYLYVTNAAAAVNDPNDLVWSRSGVEVGRGAALTVTQAGKYIVYAGGIGCSFASSEITVTTSATLAPDAIVTLDADNGGVVCGAGGTITLTAYVDTPLSGGEAIEWYRDGILVSSGVANTLSGVSNADIGHSYFAVRVSGSCRSQASNTVIPQAGTGTPVTFSPGDAYVNNISLSTSPIVVCPGSPLTFTINNAGSNSYAWSINGVQLNNAGSTASYTVPSDATLLVISCTASAPGFCSKSVTVNASLTVSQPATPQIASGPSLICSGTTVTLTATPSSDATLLYRWYRNGTVVKTSAGNTDNTYTASQGGSYTVETQTGACLSNPSAERVLTLSSAPTNLQFTVAPSQVNPGTNAIFTASANNASDYAWSASGGATVVPNGATATISWATSGPNTVTVTASNNCGTTTQTANVTVASLQMAQPTVTLVSGPSCGTGAMFQVADGYADMAVATGFTWTVTASGSGYTPTLQYFGDKNQLVFVPYDATTRTYTASVVANGAKPASIASANVTASGNLQASSYYMNGDDCYDIKKTDYSPETKWGIWSNRTQLTALSNYNYSVGGGTGTYLWTVDDPDGILAVNPTGATSASVNIQFKSSVLTDSYLVNQPTNERKVTVMCQITASTCVYTITKSIRVGDRDCCGSVADYEGNVYTAYRFGTAGCWTTENLATAYNMKQSKSLTGNKGNSGTNYAPQWTLPSTTNNSTTLTEVQARNSDYYGTGVGKPGFLYNWAIAVGAADASTAQNTTTYPNCTGGDCPPGNANVAIQDICPTGWHLPSDKEWNDLEKEITTNYQKYSTATTAPTTWSDTWRSTSGSYRGGHGTLMRNPKNPSSSYTQNPAGLSNPKEKGFSTLLVGYANSGRWYTYGAVAYYWSSSSYSGTLAWRRNLNYNQAGVARNFNNKYYMWGVRCKKNE